MIINQSIVFIASLFILGGLMHFIKPKIYLRIMPLYIPARSALVFWSGVAEVLSGLGLFWVPTRNFAIYSIITMLSLFLIVHFHMLSSPKAGAGIPKWILILRIPLQFFLMYWVYSQLI